MSRFSLPEIHCAACVRGVTEAVHSVDPAAEVRVDLASHSVEIRSDRADAVLAEAIDAAGFTVQIAA